jgi:hypothetical protein
MHILEQQTCVNVIYIRCSQLPLLSYFLIKTIFLVYIEGNNYENDLKRPYFPVAVQPSVSTSISMNYYMSELNLYKLGLRPIIWFNFYLVILPKTNQDWNATVGLLPIFHIFPALTIFWPLFPAHMSSSPKFSFALTIPSIMSSAFIYGYRLRELSITLNKILLIFNFHR